MRTVSELIKPQDMIICEGELLSKMAMIHLENVGLHNIIFTGDSPVPGAGLPLSIGVKIARPESRVFLFTDTRNLKRHHREFQTASRYHLPVTTFLFQGNKEKPDEEVDFSILSESLGVPSRRISDPSESLTASEVESSFDSLKGMLFDMSSC
ncbi:MAG: hypothetical protein KJ737_03155 [Proteobacteria bacterium]|nr:hypothetical protein [Pseudomonadota bacterium]